CQLAAQGRGLVRATLTPDQRAGRATIEETRATLAADVFPEAPLGVSTNAGVQVAVLGAHHIHPPATLGCGSGGAVFSDIRRHTGGNYPGRKSCSYKSSAPAAPSTSCISTRSASSRSASRWPVNCCNRRGS